MTDLSLVFTGGQHSIEILPIMKVSFQRTKKKTFMQIATLGVEEYAANSKNFIRKLTILRLPSKNVLSSNLEI